jgi:preprotein translocase subunit SecE
MEEGAGRSTQMVLPWHEKSLEYLKGIAEEMAKVMWD